MKFKLPLHNAFVQTCWAGRWYLVPAHWTENLLKAGLPVAPGGTVVQ